MWIMLATNSYWPYMRPGGATRGKWRISDGKEGVRVIYFHIKSSEGGSPHLCRLRTSMARLIHRDRML
jgi:hypothetical protein